MKVTLQRVNRLIPLHLLFSTYTVHQNRDKKAHHESGITQLCCSMIDWLIGANCRIIAWGQHGDVEERCTVILYTYTSHRLLRVPTPKPELKSIVMF